ncbi:Chromo domain-containing protein [Gossypium australe]|uniref:Chromo domain-containing protein n=1 Tax=Gossypium australe TaxID=47621 RepID=A0A5B6UYN8_9ROSI|nr:Chromo domain-containing protein [Gossypium australe]
MKVLWHFHGTEEATWEIEESLKSQYLNLFFNCLRLTEIVGDKVFLKVLPWRKVLQFSRKGKLSPRFIGPYEILERIELVAYRLTLPPELENIHNIFHVSMIHRYCLGLSCVIFADEIELQPDFVVQ